MNVSQWSVEDDAFHHHSLSAAREELDGYMSEAFEDAERWAGRDHSDDRAPVYVIQAPTGIGKTEALNSGYRDRAAAYATKGGALALVPRTDLAVEVSGRFKDGGNKVRVFRGRSSPNPALQDTSMCQNVERMALLADAGVSVRKNLCKGCPFNKNGECAYLAQTEEVTDDSITVASHAYLSLPDVGGLPSKPFVVTIDEDFTGSHILPAKRRPVKGGLRKYDGHHLSSHEVTRVPDPVRERLEDDKLGPEVEADTAKLAKLRGKLAGAIAVNKSGYLKPESLVSVGITKAVAGEACELEARSVPERDDFHQGSVEGLYARVKRRNAPHTDRQVVWHRIIELLEGTADQTSLYCTTAGDIVARQIKQVDSRYQDAVIIYTDATPAPDFVLDSVFKGRKAIHRAVDVLPSFQHVTGVLGAPVSRSKLVSDTEKPKQRLRDQARSVMADIKRHGNDPAKVLVITHKPVVEQLEAMLPVGVVVKHYGGLAGLDEYKHFQVAYLIGEPRPPVDFAVSIVEAIDGEVIAEEFGTGHNVFTDANGDTVANPNVSQRHTNELVQAYYDWQVTKELLQALGRLRGLNRTLNDPCRIVVLADTPLPGVVYSELVLWDDWKASLLDEVLESGFFPKSKKLFSLINEDLFKAEMTDAEKFHNNTCAYLSSRVVREGWQVIEVRAGSGRGQRWSPMFVNPNLMTARGGFEGISECLKSQFGLACREIKLDTTNVIEFKGEILIDSLIGSGKGISDYFPKRDLEDNIKEGCGEAAPLYIFKKKSPKSDSESIRNSRHETVNDCLDRFGLVPVNGTHAAAFAPDIWSGRGAANRNTQTITKDILADDEHLIRYKWKPEGAKRAQESSALVRADSIEEAHQILLAALHGAEILR